MRRTKIWLFILVSLLIIGINNNIYSQISSTETSPKNIDVRLPNVGSSNLWVNVSTENENNVELKWMPYYPTEKEKDQSVYNIYRNDVLIETLIENTSFIDRNVPVGGIVQYHITVEKSKNPRSEIPFTDTVSVYLKYPLMVTANDITRYVGVSNPNVLGQYSIKGFIGNDNANYLSKSPVPFIDPFIYNLSIPIGVYNNAVTVAGAEDKSNKYRFIYVLGKLIVSPFSRDASLGNVIVDGIRSNTVPEYYAIDCTNTKNEVQIVVNPSDADATVQLLTSSTGHISGKTITVKTEKASKQDIIFAITSQDGINTTEHRINIEQYFSFDDIVINRWGNVLAVKNNPLYNGGYKFLNYKWFRDGVLVSTAQSYSTTEGDAATSDYYVEVTTDKGETLRTCTSAITLKSNTVRIYPNPISGDETINLDADVEDELLKNAVIEVYNISGVKIKGVKVTERITPITLESPSGTYIFRFKAENGFTKELKVIKK